MDNSNFFEHNDYNLGQCYISSTEPALGVGIILKLDGRVVKVFFPNANENRNYATNSAPLKRLIHDVGSEITTIEGKNYIVQAVNTSPNNTVEYQIGNGLIIPEAQVSSSLDYNTPLKRLQQNDFDELNSFEMRREALIMQQNLTSSHVRGLCGARVELLPHQLYIAQKNSVDKLPRIMLADEVGLGKTIEAGLILHRLLAVGLVERALIIVPDALVHQWFVEMLRKFNLQCSLISDDWIKVVSDEEINSNLFSENQLNIASLEVVTNNEDIQNQVLAEKFDLLIVDEAHKLRWNHENGASKEYQIIDKLSEVSPGLILLTATPEHFGYEGHFARLRLLNKERFYSLDAFIEECKHYQKVAAIAAKLTRDQLLTTSENNYLTKLDCNLKNSDSVLQMLLERHGLSHIMYRNSRKNMKNFPQRVPILEPLDAIDKKDLELSNENLINNYVSKSIINYLAKLLIENPETKFLAICSSKEKVIKIYAELQKLINVNIAIFHEDMTIIGRDRNGAYFADISSDGAQLLICSEIGSEGRNFQFAHNLIMLDLVFDIALIEQRIGRLDRIGQTEKVKIHLPYLKNSVEEFLVHWYHEGIGIFNECLNLDFSKFDEIKNKLDTLFYGTKDFIFDIVQLKEIIEKTKVKKRKLQKELEQGRDYLLELSSFNKLDAEKIIKNIHSFNKKLLLPQFTEKILEFFGVKIDKLSLYDWQLTTESMFTDSLPNLSPNSEIATTITFSRKTACQREDILFINSDSSLLCGAIDLLLSSNTGNSTIAFIQEAEKQGIMVEVLLLLQVVAPKNLHIERFLPTTPLEFIVDSELNNVSQEVFSNAKTVTMKQQIKLPDALINGVIPQMVERSKKLAHQQQQKIIRGALIKVEDFFNEEIERLTYLAKNNPNVKASDIDEVINKKQNIIDYILKAQLNIDAIKLILSK